MKKSLFFVFSLALYLVGNAQIPTNGLIGYWSFSGNANDLSGNGNNGTVTGATLTTDRFGNPNAAYSFDGISNYISINNTFGNFGASDFTIAAWINASIIPASTFGMNIFSKRNTPSFGNFFTAIINDGKTVMEIDQSNSGDYSGITGTNTLTTNVWYFTIFERKSDSILVYINGVLEDKVHTSIIQNINNTAISAIGSSNINGVWSGGGRNFNGKLDDIRIYNRALSLSEITNLYHEGLCYQTITVTDTLIINANLTGFNPIAYQNTIKIYPNPSKDHIYINTGTYSTMSNYTIKITNSLGQEVFNSLMIQQEFYINLNNWSGNGTYFVYFIDGASNILEVRKIILQ